MFATGEIFINDVLISTPGNMYAYRGYLEALLSTSKEAKTTDLSEGLFYLDDSLFFDSTEINEKPPNNKRRKINPPENKDTKDENPRTEKHTVKESLVYDRNINTEPFFGCIKISEEEKIVEPIMIISEDGSSLTITKTPEHVETVRVTGSAPYEDAGFNDGFLQRNALVKGSRIFDLVGRPHLELMSSQKLLLPCDLRFRFTRSKPEFYLMAHDKTKKYKIKILQASMFIRTLKMSTSFNKYVTNSLGTTGTAKYPLVRRDLTSFVVPMGVNSYIWPIIKIGRVPIRIYVMFVTNTGYNGSYLENGFNFLHQSLSFLQLQLNGRSYPSIALEPKFVKHGDHMETGGQFIRAYRELLKACNVLHTDTGLGISRRNYPDGFCIFGISLNSQGGPEAFSAVTEGSLSLSVRFANETDVALNAIILFEYESLIQIRGNGKVILDHIS